MLRYFYLNFPPFHYLVKFYLQNFWKCYSDTLLRPNFFPFLFLFIYSYVHTLFEPCLPPAPCLLPLPALTSRQNLFCSLLQFCWREDISNNKKDIASLLVWDKDSYTERFLALLPCTCELQPKLARLYQTSSLLPGHLPTVASVSLRLLY
jgi:hypothetical protein